MSLKNSTMRDERCTVWIKNDEQCLDSNRGRSAWLKPWSKASTDWVSNSLTHSNTVRANQKEENSKIMTCTFFNMKLAKPHTLCKPTSSQLGLQPHSLQLFMDEFDKSAIFGLQVQVITIHFPHYSVTWQPRLGLWHRSLALLMAPIRQKYVLVHELKLAYQLFAKTKRN